MGTIDRFCLDSAKCPENSKVKGGRRRAFDKFTAFLVGMLAFGLLLTSVALPPSGHAAFPGVNGKIAFNSFRDGNTQIYVMNADGTEQTNLSNNSAGDSHPVWSPDGTKIVFMSNRHGLDEIYVMNADGTGQTRLTDTQAFGRNEYPAWSPDGTKIVFGSFRDGNGEIYVMNADGTGQTNLTNNPADDDQVPAWSPDSSKIAFGRTARIPGARPNIFVMNSDGSGVIQLTDAPLNDDFPSWSPDGTKIVFNSDRDGGLWHFDVFVMNADGSGQTRLTNNAGFDGSAAWSPDGTKILFSSDRDGNYEVYVMNADGTGQTRLTNNPAVDDYPNWQPLPAVITLVIDIKPGSFPNSVNPRGKGTIPVAILTTDSFDATTVDPTTVLFGPTGTEAAPVHVALEDVDLDGDIDMILHFNTQNTGIVCGDTSASLTGETLSGQAIEGSDFVNTVGCK